MAIAALALVLATYYGRALRWAVLLKPLRPHSQHVEAFFGYPDRLHRRYLLGRPGEFVRPYLIAVQERVSFSSQIAAWVLERIYDLLIALAIFGFALSRVQNLGDVGPVLSWVLDIGGWAVCGLCAACLIALAMIRQYSEAMTPPPDGCPGVPLRASPRSRRPVPQGAGAGRGIAAKHPVDLVTRGVHGSGVDC